MGDPQKSRLSKEMRTAERIEEYYLYASSSPLLSYILFIKFIVSREEIDENFINLIYSTKNNDLTKRKEEYSKLFNKSTMQSLIELSTQASSN